MTYDKEAAERQLQSWLQGKPVHDTVNDQCCPDFSCCVPELLVPYETRKAFVEGTEETRTAMLSMFLGGAVAAIAPEVEVHIIDGTEEGRHEQ